MNVQRKNFTGPLASNNVYGILVIDDEPVLRATFKHILQQAGFQVWVAADGHEGLEVFREVHPDLVITDMVMPGQDGAVTIRALRAERPDLPIIAMSAHVSGDGIAERLQSGAFHYVSKPVDMDALCSAIRTILAVPCAADSDAL